MTAIVVTNDTLCADRKGTAGSACQRVRKVFLVKVDGNEFALAISGNFATGNALVQWFKDGCQAESWPKAQAGQDWARLVVLDQSGMAFHYETEPTPEVIDHVGYAAYGDGAGVALGALAVGALPGEAILAANKHSASCGFGVEGYTLKDGVFDRWELP